MNNTIKYILASLAAFLVVGCSIDLPAKERSGVQAVIVKKDGSEIRGELLSVKENSLLLMTNASGTMINVLEISQVTVFKKGSRRTALLGGVYGIVVGGVLGVFVAPQKETGLFHGMGNAFSRLYYGLGGTLIGGFAGLMVGLGIQCGAIKKEQEGKRFDFENVDRDALSGMLAELDSLSRYKQP